MKFIEDAKLKIGVFLRERKERAHDKKARKPQDPPHVTTPLWLVQACKFAAWVATISLMYFLWLYTLDIARDRAESLHFTHVGAWVGDLLFWFPHIFGFAIIAFGIPYVAKIAIPTFVSLTWRQDPTAKVWSLIIAVAVSLVVISGTFTVQGHNIMERDRDAAVAVEQVQQGRAAIEGQIAAKEAELRSMMENRNAYLAQAASVGAAEWERSYIAQTAANDPQRDRIVRALGAARAADAVRAELSQLRQQAAASTAVASVQGEIVTERTGWIAQTLGWLEGVRAILLSFVMDIVALIMPLIALRLEQARNRQMGVEGSGWAPAGLRIEDLRDEEDIVPQPMKPAREVVTDAETGEELIRITPKPHWRKQKGKKQRIETNPDIPPDETGFTDSKRTAVTLGGEMEVPSVAEEMLPVATHGVQHGVQHEPEKRDPEGYEDVARPTLLNEPPHEQREDGERNQAGSSEDGVFGQPEPSEELFPIEEEYLEPTLPVSSEQVDEGNGENTENPADENQDEPREPETNPARMIAAE